MRSYFRPVGSLLLAVLVLAWTGLCGAGVLTGCLGGDQGPCTGGAVHSHFASLSESCGDEPCHESGDTGIPASPCPDDHEHISLEMPMAHPGTLAVAPPVWFEFLACPLPPPVEWVDPAVMSTDRISDRAPPPVVPPPPFLACGPLLI